MYFHICEVSANFSRKMILIFWEAICIRGIFVDNHNYISQLEKLEDVVWTTRKNRINAEERLLTINRFVQHINIYYACLSATISIIGLWYADKALTMLGAILAPIVTICIAFLNSQRYEQRAADIKRNYIELQKILYQIQLLKLEPTANFQKLEKIETDYCELMDKVENHWQCDYWKTCFQNFSGEKSNPSKNKSKKSKTFDNIRYCVYEILRWSMHGIAYVAPVLGYGLIRLLFEY